MLMQLLQERLVRQYEAQSSDTLQDTIKAAILVHVGLNATKLQGTMLSEVSGKRCIKRTDSGE